MEVYKFPSLNGITITIHGSFEETAQPEVDGSMSSTPSGPRGGSRYHSAPKHKRIPLSKNHLIEHLLLFLVQMVV